MSTVTLNMDQITDPKFAHRIDHDTSEMVALMESIKSVGLINPISVKSIGNDQYEVIAGHRRFLAISELGIDIIEVVIRNESSQTNERIKFDENNIRANLSPMEEALALDQMMTDDNIDIIELVKRTGKKQPWLEARLLLLNYDDEIKDALHEGKLTIGIANELHKITDKSHRLYLLEYAQQSGASHSVIQQWRIQWQHDQQREGAEETVLPELPPAGQQIVIQIPCGLCTTSIDHTKSIVMRVCRECYSTVQQTNNG